jgi:sugar phosphate isomerase/epimerase
MTDNRVPVAIQLYSLRTIIPEDVPGSLQKLADMGYEGVEFAGYYGLHGDELRTMLDDCGLRCAGAHTAFPTLEGDAFEETVAINKAIGNDRLIIPGANLEELSATIDKMNAVHERARSVGMRAGYHNHVKEFEAEGGTTKFARIFSETPDDFLVQLDIGWAAAAGQDVAALLREYGRRIETVHVKEHNSQDKTAVVGEGEVDWSSVFDILEGETGVKWYVVEQEQYAVGPMESAQGCLENIRKLGR